jgi:hypothetical protein
MKRYFCSINYGHKGGRAGWCVMCRDDDGTLTVAESAVVPPLLARRIAALEKVAKAARSALLFVGHLKGPQLSCSEIMDSADLCQRLSEALKVLEET